MQNNDYVQNWANLINFLHPYYDQGGGRCEPNTSGYCDCSGGTCYCMDENPPGLNVPCTNSFQFAQWCHDAQRPQWLTAVCGPGQGTSVTAAQAVRIPGCLGFHGDNEGQSPDQFGDGHIKTSVGDGVHSYEAMSHSLGVGESIFLSSFITYYALMPGMDYDLSNLGPAPKGVPLMQGAPTMVFTAPPKVHIQTAGKWKGRLPIIGAQLGDDGLWRVYGYNGVELSPFIDAEGRPTRPVNAFGVSMLMLGKLNSPIYDHVDYGGGVVFVAGDGGTFGPYVPRKIHYGA